MRCSFDERQYTAPSRALSPGTCLAGRYYIGRVLGQGGFGITYVAWDELLEIRVAIKGYYPENNISGRKNKDLREARIMSKFSNLPGIVVAKDFFEDNNMAYLVMEYVSGTRISNYIKKNGPMRIEEVLGKLEPVIQSLAIIHESGYLHKYISANNIMITDEGKLVLIDFGAARTMEPSDATMTVAVKIGYSPEEQYRTTGRLGPWSDIYSLCATIYYMLTGIVPAESVERVITDRVKPLSDNDNIGDNISIRKAIDKGMAVMASDRYQSVYDIYQKLYPGKSLTNVIYEDAASEEAFTDDVNNTMGTETISETSIRRALDRVLDRTEKNDRKKSIRKIIIIPIGMLLAIAIIMMTMQNEAKDNRSKTEEVSTESSLIHYETAKVENTQEESTVISQSIPASTKVADGTVIELTISKGKKTKDTKATAKPTVKPTVKPAARPTVKSASKPKKADDSVGALN